MVERYALSPMKELWTTKANLERWLEVELAVMEAYEKLGMIPAGSAEKAKKNAVIDLKLFEEFEKQTDHEVIAFVKMATSKMGDEARFFHYGLTSSDVIDTALSLALVKACDLIIEQLDKLLQVLWKLALEHKETLTIGRTHGVHAEPTSFGLKVLNWYAEMLRNKDRLLYARRQISYGKISGAVGNYANVPPAVEKLALEILGLQPTPVSSQIVNRDHHAFFVFTLALLASGIERIATEIRHLQKTEVLEVQEPFKEGQKGSSAMPHKQNPILCERLCGLARIMRSYVSVALENNNLWHERDISHSSAERYIFPDATQTIYYMLVKTVYLLENLVVYKDRMLKNLNLTNGLIFSQKLMLALIDKGMSRSEAYDLVQNLSLRCWKTGESLKELAKKNISILNEEEIEKIFDPREYLKNVDEIYSRFGGGWQS
ncbi:adenylosuccinate lyase [Pseudothermotoga thermarum]|uniref:Adenylosuccinate lyase n=1 Tax=Pseudothermotoga thermarum DSM 5069 TaxID=688269 RepID=F7YWC5_9THEM|nr:adenylosuccinate lyase [Pseudothermotoga thermarum]AEH51903.1 Adenylosuccinate lyase [Pseudothermotoga thermarum DSM 5069]